jgi:N-acetylmuramoyl-L-alanine amidase
VTRQVVGGKEFVAIFRAYMQVLELGEKTNINSTSIGIELDNNGTEVFSELQINSLLALLTKLKKDYNIPAQNIIGHADILHLHERKIQVNCFLENISRKWFCIWYDEF